MVFIKFLFIIICMRFLNSLVFIIFLIQNLNSLGLESDLSNYSDIEVVEESKKLLPKFAKQISDLVDKNKECSDPIIMDFKKKIIIVSIYLDDDLFSEFSTYLSFKVLTSLVLNNLVSVEKALASQPHNCDRRSLSHFFDKYNIGYQNDVDYLDSPLHFSKKQKDPFLPEIKLNALNNRELLALLKSA